MESISWWLDALGSDGCVALNGITANSAAVQSKGRTDTAAQCEEELY